MTIRTGSKREAFGRLFVLGGFTLVTPSGAPGRDGDGVNARLKREQGSAKVALVRDAGQEPPNRTRKSRPEDEERQAIERGEDEGMMVGRE